MAKISFIAIIWIWHCVYNDQLSANDALDYYYIPLVSQHNNKANNGQVTGQSSDELGLHNTPNTRSLLLQEPKLLKIKQLEFIIASLAKQLIDTKKELTKKVTQADLDKTNKAVADLTAALQTTNDNLALKASQTNLDQTNSDVTDLTASLQTKADKADLNQLISHVTDLTTTVDGKADKTDLNQLISDVTDLTTTVDGKADKADLNQLISDVTDLTTKVDEITIPSSIGTIPTSCDDLKTIGFVKSGIFSVIVNKQVQDVYCDFTKSNSPDFQQLIGVVDVKSTQVYFYAQKSTSYSTVGTGVPFDLIKLNVGNAFSTSGEFVAPRPGKYYFAFSGISDNGVVARVVLQLKTATVDWTGVGEAYGSSTYQTLTLFSTLQLSQGDQIRIFLKEGIVFDDARSYTHFVGWLIDEDELPV